MPGKTSPLNQQLYSIIPKEAKRRHNKKRAAEKPLFQTTDKPRKRKNSSE
jgi:hypothetical protein